MRTEEWNINKKRLGNENIMTFCNQKKKKKMCFIEYSIDRQFRKEEN